jgi:cytochrome c-type biogenesis protein CcmH
MTDDLPTPPWARIRAGGAVALRAVFLAFVLLGPPAHAVQPDEILPDPALEARARDITKELRCVVCQSESIDDSNADIARDLRLLVRERIVAGDTDAEVRAFVVDRYGEFVLFRPPFTAGNAALWLAGPALLLVGGGIAFAFIRRRAGAAAPPQPAPLTPDERRRLDGLLED